MSEQQKDSQEPTHAERFVEMVKRVAQTPKTEFQKAEAERKMRKAAEKGTRKE